MTSAIAFKREERFIVIKRKHLDTLVEGELRTWLAFHDIAPVECVVVESDWPEYEAVWGMIERRVTGQNTAVPADLVEALRQAAQTVFDRGYVSEFIADERPDFLALEKALADLTAHHPSVTVSDGDDFQSGVADWMRACFGPEIAADRLERADRFTEEALELAQTMPGFTADRAHALVDYVFERPIGERHQEVGGVMVTLAALCNSFDLSIAAEADRELARVWTKVEAIRAKQASKPVGSPLPVAASLQPAPHNNLIDSLPYQAVFNAIADATKALTPKAQISISVECFKASLRTALNSEGKA